MYTRHVVSQVTKQSHFRFDQTSADPESGRHYPEQWAEFERSSGPDKQQTFSGIVINVEPCPN
jgi:hypothetical protein